MPFLAGTLRTLSRYTLCGEASHRVGRLEFSLIYHKSRNTKNSVVIVAAAAPAVSCWYAHPAAIEMLPVDTGAAMCLALIAGELPD